ncbi:hypothetical protein SAMN04489712_106109 [Thermomonospora echinospora]|uniref:DUF1616 domain-containing protein n=1 Tax=Thermomonospora echinospora TaxID=1992 RepID=A0A1H6AZ57_9ACTN|nr:hypothetical protein [Thermomonospora echinospora]SEG53682.1 hypothetical protein SAMN04489712_106109 [Thermomonospora echinospora]
MTTSAAGESTERSPSTRFMVWFFFVSLGALVLTVWLLSLGAKGSEISGVLSLLVALVSPFIPVFIDRLSREQGGPGLPLPSRKWLMFVTAALLGMTLSLVYWFAYHKPDLNVTDRVVLGKAAGLRDGSTATVRIRPPLGRSHLYLVFGLTNRSEVGDCVDPATLRGTLTVDGVDRGEIDARAGQELRYPLGKAENSVDLTVTLSEEKGDRTCSVDLRVTEAVLYNEGFL